MDEEGSTLKLIMDKGPRAGETLEFRSGSVIKIGRVVRGNTIGIKDGGISTKHLSIQFDSAAAHWTLLDLDSSNGTILNSVELVPLQPVPIKDGDTIKIGEITSILVKIEVGEMSRLRRNPRRRGKGGESDNVAAGVGGGDLSQGGGGSELGLGLESVADLGGNVVEVLAPVKRKLRGRPPKGKGAGSKNEAEDVGGESVVEVKQGNEVNVRRTRSSKKKGQGVEFNPTLPTVSESLADGNGKVRGRKNIRDDSTENVEIGGLDEVSVREGCSESKKTAAVDESLPSGSKEAVGVDVWEEIRVPDESNSGGEGRGSLKKEVRAEVDLEKMTLGEWFDYLEVYLPKQIYEETEAMILKMKQEAAKFHEFRMQQENANRKGKKPMD